MRARMYALVVGCLLVANSAFAADVDGRWTGNLETPMGEVPITFVFKADGAKLTGHMVGMDGGELKLDNGKIEGDKISYSVTIDLGGMALEMTYKGVVTASEIKLDLDVFGMPFALVVTKAK